MASTDVEIPSQETIKKVSEEGLEARNLVNYIADGTLDVKISKKPPTSPRPQSVSPNPISVDSGKRIESKLLQRNTKRRTALSRPKSRLRSASAGRNPEKDLRTRYWTFLFENLHRAVDEIYQTCEMDESIVESKEAIMMLENYSKDFHALIQYININKNYEKTAPPNRPTSLAWEVRKSSPGKSFLKNVFIEKLAAGSSQAKRVLCFDIPSEPSKLLPTVDVEKSQEPKLSHLHHIELSEIINENITLPDTKRDNIIVSGCHDDIKVKNEDDVTVSVVTTTSDEVFPCNQNLIINEVHCLSDKVCPEKPSIIIENECENQIDNVGSNNFALNDTINEKRVMLENVAREHICVVETNDPDKNNVSPSPIKAKPINDSLVSHSTSHNQILNEKSTKTLKSDNKINISTVKLNCIKTHPAASETGKKKLLLKTKLPHQNSSNDKVLSANNICKSDSLTEKKSVKDKQMEISSKISVSSEESKKENEVSKPATLQTSKNDTSDVSASKTVHNANLVKNAVVKSKVNTNKSAVNNNSQNLHKYANVTSVTKPTNTKSFSARASVKINSDDKKPAKPSNSGSAIKRNISYVQTLSSKNQLGKPVNDVKQTPKRTVSHACKLPQKSGSMSSLNKIVSVRNWKTKASSVEQIPEVGKTAADEDSDGWETVRGRNRCRNSPAKKLPFNTEKKETQALQMAKLNQSRIGGFPYNNKSSPRVTTKNVQKNTESPKYINRVEEKAKKVSAKQSESELDVNYSMDDTSTSDTQSSVATSSIVCNGIIPNSVQAALKNSVDDKGKIKHSNCTDAIIVSKELGTCNQTNTANIKVLENKSCNINLDCDAKDISNMFIPNFLTRSVSAPCLSTGHEHGICNYTKSMCISDQSLGSQRYVNMKQLKKKLSDRGIYSSKKRNRKFSSKSVDNGSSENSMLNTSLDESDNGLTSDDQDGHMSHDEAFDAQCQDLCDTAWKYKILEQQVHKLELSWGEQMDRFDLELRTPGRALEMHEKLSSPFRKKSLLESIRSCNEKQLKAQEQRERLLVEKAQKFKFIQKKRQEMKALVEQRQEKQRLIMEQKLQRAEEKRKKQLEMIIRKAHDEEEKVNEIAFINTLEAQNKRHDLISKEKDHEARLHDIQEERQRKQEEKAAKEAAAEERRKILEAERLARLNEMQEKRKMRDHKVEQLFLVKEKERQELANQKARDREQRLSALNAQQQSTIEELQKKIQLKQEESARRHEENMEQIRQKAFELSVRKCSSNNDDVPQPVPYETKKICTMCNVLIGSEVYLLSHLRGKKHQETVKDQHQGQDPSVEELELYNLKHIVDASTDQLDPNIALDKERQKALKKRCKKLRQRMSNRGKEYESETEKTNDGGNSNVKPKITKIVNDIKKLLASEKISNENSLLSALERCFNEVDSILEKKSSQDKIAFRAAGGISSLIDIFKLLSSVPKEKSSFIHKKLINHVNMTAESVVENCYENSVYVLFSNKLGSLLDLLIRRLHVLIPDNCNQLTISSTKSTGINIQVDTVAGKLMHFLSRILTALSVKHIQLSADNIDKMNQKENKHEEFQFRVQDAISYIVSIGIVDKISQYFHGIQGPINNEIGVANFLLDCIAFLTAIIKLYSDCFSSSSKTDDTTQLIATFKVTNMIGSVSLLYGLLLHSGASSRDETPPPQLPKEMEILAFSTLCMLNHMAVMNLQAFQSILGSEGLSLQLRHITSHLLWYCNHWTSDVLLHEVILLVGYFTVLNGDNQSLIQAGQRPTVLQQLCSLPFLYFSDSELTDILFPTLIACCFNNASNKTILEQEMTSELLSNYIEVKYLNTEENNASKNKNTVPDKRWLFSTRFPKNCWSSAKHYFSAK